MKTEFGFIGWCNDPKENHDKIWGYFFRPTDTSQNRYISKSFGWNVVVFWARRGKAMQFKSDTTGPELSKLVRSKMNKGYESITERKFLEIWPSFIQDCEQKLMWDVLSGKVK